MKVDRDSLVAKLQAVQAGLSIGKETVVQAGCFCFKDGNVYTFNDEVACKIPCDVELEGAVPAKQFLDILTKFRDDTIAITLADGELRIQGNGKQAGFRIESEVLLPIDQIDVIQEWHPCDVGMADALGKAASCVGTDEEKFYRTCVHVGESFVESCDNFHMIRCYVPELVKHKADFLVRGTAVKPLEGINLNAVAITEDWLAFKGDDGLEYYVRKYVDEYPELDRFFASPAAGEFQKFTPPSGFGASLEAAMIFTNENEISSVKVLLKDGKVTIHGEGATGWFKERLNTPYNGKNLGFSTSPKVLKQFAEKHPEGVIHNNMLRVSRQDEFVYVTSLEPLE